eukprot:TRINITY_DN845_c2_g1_i1.p1 TRINITY_DN845_c2_g1~~TRINITY_DN845_c2_g1_i1.p1  ORF type:complete len:510 (+),score=112.82 TRINITY_DN845_c2_g1_i1:42-1532(+)
MKTTTLILVTTILALSTSVRGEDHDHDHDHDHDEDHDNHGNETHVEHLTAHIYDANKNGELEAAELSKMWVSVGNAANETARTCTMEAIREHNNITDVHEEHAEMVLEGYFLYKVIKACEAAHSHEEEHKHGEEEEEEEEDPTCHALENVEDHYKEELEACVFNAPEVEAKPCNRPSQSERWGYTLLAVCVISLVAVFGIFVTLPVLLTHHFLLQTMLAFAVGALLGDAFYHILPEVLGIHSHSGGGHDGHDHAAEEPMSQHELNLKMTIILLTVLVFYWIDWMSRAVLGGKDPHEAMEDKTPPSEPINTKDSVEPVVEKMGETAEEKKVNWWKWTPMSDVKQIVWVVLVADGVHNVTDGLSIAAAFGKSTTLGWSTTLASALHEIPQEVGDFAVMLAAGISPFQAVMFNLLSACTAILAAIIALIIGDNSADSEEWILCVTIGSFLYLAIGVVVPELLADVKKISVAQFCLHTIGMACGALILWIIAITEDENTC